MLCMGLSSFISLIRLLGIFEPHKGCSQWDELASKVMMELLCQLSQVKTMFFELTAYYLREYLTDLSVFSEQWEEGSHHKVFLLRKALNSEEYFLVCSQRYQKDRT